MPAPLSAVELRRRLVHVRWIGGGTGTGKSLARDQLWDAEIRRQARELDLPVLEVDGTRGPADLAGELEHRFRLG